nr:immunoglobulin light chain junction region [Macaca mulatta]
CQHYYSTPWTF